MTGKRIAIILGLATIGDAARVPRGRRHPP